MQKTRTIKIALIVVIASTLSGISFARTNRKISQKATFSSLIEKSYNSFKFNTPPLKSNSSTSRKMGPSVPDHVDDSIAYQPAGYDDPETVLNFCLSSLQNGTTFEGKVSGCPQIAHQIVWQRPDGSKVDFEHWTTVQKTRINQIFDRINRNESDLGIRCPHPEDGVNVELRRIYISENEAFDMYAAHISQAIYLESNRLVPWSLRDNSREENASILDSSQYFSIITRDGSESHLSIVRSHYSPGTAYRTPAWHYSDDLLSCDPRLPYFFLNGANSATRTNLIQSNQVDTIKSISWWFHKNAYHTTHPATYYPSFDEWVSHYIFLQDRLSTTPFMIGGDTIQGIVMNSGCHSVANLFLELARGINIPIRIFWVSEQPFTRDIFNYAGLHMGIAFHWTQADYKIVLHADDLYVQNKSIFPINMGTPMNEAEVQTAFINQVWITPAQAEAWGVRFYRNLPLILPGQDVNQTIPPTPSSQPNNGYFGGYGQMRNSMTGLYSLFSNRRVENGYQLCGWNELILTYCDDPTPMKLNFYGEMYTNVNFNYRYTMPALPISRTVDDYLNRAEECVMANGGCDGLRTSINNEAHLFGSNYYRR
ncbi:MAG: hypothetical protein IPJ69_09690 [Deltaproteobacteria bacterium]|nr:MAG: hypothetical protein IPJ69_09690 [Deltaproteobacteria bacterium]